MGFYIQTPQPRGKAKQLIDLHAAVRLDIIPRNVSDCPSDKVIICVVENGPFDAAGVVFSQAELAAFQSPEDPRLKHWLLLDRELLPDLQPHVISELEY